MPALSVKFPSRFQFLIPVGIAILGALVETDLQLLEAT